MLETKSLSKSYIKKQVLFESKFYNYWWTYLWIAWTKWKRKEYLDENLCGASQTHFRKCFPRGKKN